MTQSLPPLDALLVTIVLATLAIGLPILVVLSIRFLWDRNLKLGRSKELEKLIWQLHRIASAMEDQTNLTFPAAQPGTEESRGLANLQQPATQSAATTRSAAGSAAVSGPATRPVHVEQQEASLPATQRASGPPPASREPSAEGHPHGGVNSMFGF
jgi:hypothetical protein